MGHKIITLIMALLAIAGIYLFFFFTKKPPILNDEHIHADFKVYLNGLEYNFSKDKYMSSENKSLNPFIHLHDMDGGLIHQHMTTIALSVFFNSLKIKFNYTCFSPDNNTAYCNNGQNKLKMFVQHVTSNNNSKVLEYGDWQQNYDMGNYEIQDLDRILIIYGQENDNQIKNQMDAVTSSSCIFSNKCPWKGVPPPDESSCVSDNGPCKAIG